MTHRTSVGCWILRSVVGVSFCWITVTSFLVRASEPSEPEQVVAAWESQRFEIVSATITYRYFLNAGIFAPLPPDDVHAVIASYDLAERPADLKSLIDRLVETPPYFKDPPGVIRRFQYTAGKTRLESPNIIDVDDGEVRIQVDRNNDVINLRQTGKSRTYSVTLDDFRIVPGEHITAPAIRLRAREADSLLFSVLHDGGESGSSIVQRLYYVDPATAMVLREVIYGGGGKVYRDRVQYGFRTYPGDVIFPTVIIDARYWQEETLGSLSIAIVQNATFNEPLENDAFLIEAAANTPIFHERDGEEDVVWTSGPVSDVKSFVSGAGAIHPPTGGHILSFRRFCLAILGMLIVAIGVLFHRESRRKRIRR